MVNIVATVRTALLAVISSAFRIFRKPLGALDLAACREGPEPRLVGSLPTLIPTWSGSWGKAGSLYELRPLSFNSVKWLIERDLDYGVDGCQNPRKDGGKAW